MKTLLTTAAFAALFAASSLKAADGLSIAWTNNLLTVSGPNIPGGPVVIWYLEAFCRSGSTHRNWKETTIPHKTTLVSASPDGKRIELLTKVEPTVEIRHVLRAGADDVTFELVAKNTGGEFVDVQWFQPCIRVGGFTGLEQSNYHNRCFIFTDKGLVTLDKTRRTEEAIYKGGQVYVPAGVHTNDVNPRPLSPDVPVNALMGCFSADGRQLLATAWDSTQELFQGVIKCIHNDPRIGGLKPGETKNLRGKLYILPNDPQALLRRYREDFGQR